MPETYDVIVVGSGAMGSAAAWTMARAGKRVLLLEQYAVGHANGSSHGGSRIIRYTHAEAEYAALMPLIFPMWRELEAEAGESLMQLCGGLYMGAPNDPFLLGAQTALSSLDMPYEMLDSAEMQNRYPQFRATAGQIGLYQKESGILAASRCVAAFVRLAVAHGATLHEHARVSTISQHGADLRVDYEIKGRRLHATAHSVVLAAGPWAAKLLPELVGAPLPLRVTRQQVAYYGVTDASLWSPERCPIYIYTNDPHVYGFPIYEKPGQIKVAQELFDLEIDPDAPRVALPEAVDALSAIVAENFVAVDPEPVEVVPCLYTETPNRDFIIDRHPEMPNLVFAAGFSGRGFKFSIAVGRLLADLASSDMTPAEHPLWLPWWSLGRFNGENSGRAGVELFAHK